MWGASILKKGQRPTWRAWKNGFIEGHHFKNIQHSGKLPPCKAPSGGGRALSFFQNDGGNNGENNGKLDDLIKLHSLSSITCTATFTASSIPIALVSITTASSAATKGAVARSESRLSRARRSPPNATPSQ